MERFFLGRFTLIKAKPQQKKSQTLILNFYLQHLMRMYAGKMIFKTRQYIVESCVLNRVLMAMLCWCLILSRLETIYGESEIWEHFHTVAQGRRWNLGKKTTVSVFYFDFWVNTDLYLWRGSILTMNICTIYHSSFASNKSHKES